jgi:hypothetical protein
MSGRSGRRALLAVALLGTVTLAVIRVDQARPEAAAAPSARVGAFFFDGWSGELGNFHWGGLLGTPYSGRRPLSGWTDDRPEAIEAQLRWARRAGISFFAFDWYHEPDPGNGPINMAFETYWKLRDHSGVGAALAYVNQDAFVIPSERWADVTERWASDYFTRPDYVRVDGKPLLIILEERHFILQWGGAEGANQAIASLQAAARRHGLPGVFVVGGHYLDWSSEHCFPQCLDTDPVLPSVDFDAITEFTYPRILEPTAGPRPYPEVAAALKRTWTRIAAQSAHPHIPAVMAGFDPRPMIRAGQVSPEGDHWPLLGGYETWWVTRPADVGGLVGDAISWVDANPAMRVEAAPAPPIVLIQSWNELQEGAILLPTDENGYGYLRAIAEAVGVSWAQPSRRVLRVATGTRGSVTSTPGGIACPPRCTAAFDEGVEVTLNARVGRGSTLDGWSANCRRSGAATCSLVLVRDSTARALVTPTNQRRAITVTWRGHTARGRVRSLDGYAGCIAIEPLQVERRQGSRWVARGSAVTNEHGRFGFGIPARRGTYRVTVRRSSVGDHTCLAAASKPTARGS